MALNAKQRRFCEEYLIDLNATQAAIRAGYSAHAANKNGPRMLVNAGVAAEIERLKAEREKRTEVTADWVIKRLQEEANERGEGSSHSARIRALELLGRHVDLFKDSKLNLEVSGPNGGPIPVQVYIPSNGRDQLPDDTRPTPAADG